MPALKHNSKKTAKKVAPRAGFNPVKDDTEESRASKVIWSTDALGAALDGLNQGFKLKANPFYENNTKLLKADLLFERTPEELEHYKVCMNDVLEFAKECQLMTPQGIQHVTLRDYQEDYLKHLQQNRLSIFLSCRQSGKTTTSAIFMLWYVLFNVDKNALVLGNKFKTAKEILDKIKNIFYYLPYYLKPGIRKWNEAEIVFDNGCRIMAEATTINSGISFTYHCVLADEFAHVAPNIVDKFYNQIFPTITAGKARFIISSTQNGFNLFYKLYKGAEDGENDYGPFKVDWPQVPEWNPNTMQWEKRDEVWHQKQAANLGGEEAFQKQFGTNFDVTGNTLISAKKIRKLQLEAEEFKPIDIPGLRRAESFKWKSEIEDVNQLRSMFLTFTIDLAEGVGQDSDIMNIHALKWDSHLERSYVETIGVCEIKDISVPDFAEIVVEFISRYCDMDNIILSFESNTFGGLFYKSITTYTDKHPELRWDAGIIARYERDMFSESKGIDVQKGKDKYSLGFRVTSATKKGACKLFKVFYEEGLIQNKYTKYLTQMENFSDVKGNGSYEASYGHDDIIMAEVQQAALMQTLKFKLLQELFEGELQRDNKISSEEFVDFYSDMYRDDSVSFYEKAYGMNLSGGDNLYMF